MQLGLGQRRAGKTWGYWPRPLLPWPKHVIHSWQGPGAWPGLDFSGDECFSRPWFEITALSSTKRWNLFCFLGSDESLFFNAFSVSTGEHSLG